MFKGYNSDSDCYDGTVHSYFEQKIAFYIERCNQNQVEGGAVRH